MIRFAWGKNGFWREERPSSQVVRLEELPAGERAQIVSLSGPEDVVHRLEELGLRPGTVIRVFRPGNPCIVCLGGSKLGVRADGHVQILVSPLPGPPRCRHRHGWGWRRAAIVSPTAPGKDVPDPLPPAN
ncbi:MAG: FeoA family protein [Thermogutta sp.]|nr:FeoA family protein [Thermogutta sp.]HOP76158.1 FeoA family protein [Thermogutta sp.]HPU05825.1 FeoA family protein [Thermogutta sp.]HQF13321.1 FeoA family protein [Thermogutta sp.]